MHRTYSKPNKEWEGFRPVAYTLNKAWELPLTQISGEGDQKREQATSVVEVLRTLKAKQIRGIADRAIEATEITTEQGKVVLGGPSFNREVAEAFLDLEKDGINPFDARWFWYDRDHVSDDLMASYVFFVVHKDAIVREQVSFCDYSDSAFDPSVFEPDEDARPIWMNHPYWDEAWVRYWYRKFYAETRTGQLMVLRPDEPILFYYERPQTRDLNREMQLATQLKTYRLLLVAIPLLVALAFPHIRDYMAIAAAVLGADFLWVCWQTRKLGRR
jgi:hypothetical protein